MSNCIKTFKGNGHYCIIELTKMNNGFVYYVCVCPIIDEHNVGYPIRQMTYTINEKAKAMATYRRYVKTYCK